MNMRAFAAVLQTYAKILHGFLCQPILPKIRISPHFFVITNPFLVEKLVTELVIGANSAAVTNSFVSLHDPLKVLPGIVKSQVRIGVHGHAVLRMTHDILKVLRIHALAGHLG